LNDWTGQVAQKYFQTAAAAIRRHDPNHLILGSRFAQDAPDAAWQWAGKTCDVVSFNFYPRVDFGARRVVGMDEHLREHFALCQKPMMITEWSFPALDAKDSAGTAIPSTHGAGMRVDSQAQRAAAYTIMQESLLRTPFVVGSHYFMWSDEPASGISRAFPENSNYGLVNESDAPYAELTRAATEVNAQALSIHAGNRFVSSLKNVGPSTNEINTLIRRDGLVSLAREGENFTIENGALRLKSDGGALQIFTRNGAEWIESGRYYPLLEQVSKGQTSWVGSDKIENLKILENTPRKLAAEIVFAALQNGNETSSRAWKTRVLLTVKAGQPWFEAKVLSIDSGGETLGWNGYFHYAISNIGGDATDDVAVAQNIPNYWLSSGAWRDEKRALQFGAMARDEDGRLNINFWKGADGIQHPDAFRALAQTLAPRARWTPPKDEPAVIIFSLRESPEIPRPLSALARFLNATH